MLKVNTGGRRNEKPLTNIQIEEVKKYAVSLGMPKERTAMMKEMLNLLNQAGYKQASLAVQKENYAVKMYKNVGFEVVDENEEEYIMLYKF